MCFIDKKYLKMRQMIIKTTILAYILMKTICSDCVLRLSHKKNT